MTVDPDFWPHLATYEAALLLPDAPARDAAIRDALSAATGAGFDYRLIQNAATFRGLPTGPAMGMLALYQEAVERKIAGGGA